MVLLKDMDLDDQLFCDDAAGSAPGESQLEAELSVAEGEQEPAAPVQCGKLLVCEESDEDSEPASGNEALIAEQGDYKLPTGSAQIAKTEVVESVCVCIVCRKDDRGNRKWWVRSKVTLTTGKVYYENTDNLCYRCGFLADARVTLHVDLQSVVRRVTGTDPGDSAYRSNFFEEAERIDPITGEISSRTGAEPETAGLCYDIGCGFQVYKKASIIPRSFWDKHHKDSCNAAEAGIMINTLRDNRGIELEGVVVDKCAPLPEELRRVALTFKALHEGVAHMSSLVMLGKEMLSFEHGLNQTFRLADLKMEEHGHIPFRCRAPCRFPHTRIFRRRCRHAVRRKGKGMMTLGNVWRGGRTLLLSEKW